MIIIVIEFMFVGINIFWALLRAYFNPRLTARAKMSLSRAQNIFMPANINSIVLFLCITSKHNDTATQFPKKLNLSSRGGSEAKFHTRSMPPADGNLDRRPFSTSPFVFKYVIISSSILRRNFRHHIINNVFAEKFDRFISLKLLLIYMERLISIYSSSKIV